MASARASSKVAGSESYVRARVVARGWLFGNGSVRIAHGRIPPWSGCPPSVWCVFAKRLRAAGGLGAPAWQWGCAAVPAWPAGPGVVGVDRTSLLSFRPLPLPWYSSVPRRCSRGAAVRKDGAGMEGLAGQLVNPTALPGRGARLVRVRTSVSLVPGLPLPSRRRRSSLPGARGSRPGTAREPPTAVRAVAGRAQEELGSGARHACMGEAAFFFDSGGAVVGRGYRAAVRQVLGVRTRVRHRRHRRLPLLRGAWTASRVRRCCGRPPASSSTGSVPGTPPALAGVVRASPCRCGWRRGEDRGVEGELGQVVEPVGGVRVLGCADGLPVAGLGRARYRPDRRALDPFGGGAQGGGQIEAEAQVRSLPLCERVRLHRAGRVQHVGPAMRSICATAFCPVRGCGGQPDRA